MKMLSACETALVVDGDWSVGSVAAAVAGASEDPFYVMDLSDVVQKYKLWKQLLPRVEPFYAVKCNDSSLLLRTLAALGTSFDCASKNEINAVLTMGVKPERIIFANPAKMASHIRFAAQESVNLMTFDSDTELMKIKRYHPTAECVIRIRCDASDAQCPLGIKFGCDAEREAPRLLKLASVLQLKVVGVSFHVGSGCGDPSVFRRALWSARCLFDMSTSLGYKMTLVDIGGGFPGNNTAHLAQIAQVVNETLDELFPQGDGVRVIAEPGRYFAATAYTLAACVHSKRVLYGDGGSTRTMYFINDGVYGSFNCVLYDHQHVVAKPLMSREGTEVHRSSIWGPSCDGLDCVIEETMLPDLEIGDWLMFEDMGAYTIPIASPFNGFPLPRVITLVRPELWLMLKDLWPFTPEHFTVLASVCDVASTQTPPVTPPASLTPPRSPPPPATHTDVQCLEYALE